MADNIVEQIERLISALELKNQRHLAALLGISPARITDAKTRGVIPSEWLVRAAEKGINPAWVKTGTGPMKIEASSSTAAGASESQPKINAAEGMLITKKVLESGTGYANALWHNLKSFEAAVDKEERVEELTKEVRELKEMMVRMEARMIGKDESHEKKSLAS